MLGFLHNVSGSGVLESFNTVAMSGLGFGVLDEVLCGTIEFAFLGGFLFA